MFSTNDFIISHKCISTHPFHNNSLESSLKKLNLWFSAEKSKVFIYYVIQSNHESCFDLKYHSVADVTNRLTSITRFMN